MVLRIYILLGERRLNVHLEKEETLESDSNTTMILFWSTHA